MTFAPPCLRRGVKGEHYGMANTIIRHRVHDFEEWKRVFDSTADLRRQQGEESWRVFRSAEDPNDVTVVTTFRDADSAASWIGSEGFHSKIVESGVIGEPEVRFVNEA